MALRGAFEHWRTMIAHKTAAKVQKKLRRAIYDRIAALGPGTVGRQRSGALTLSLIAGVEQLENYFRQFLPQFLLSLLPPVLILAGIARSARRRAGQECVSSWRFQGSGDQEK